MTLPARRPTITLLKLSTQRVLFEGNFVSTYKFALLLALADLSIELGDDSGSPLMLSVDDLAEKFIHVYWRQTLPYISTGGRHDVLRQSTGRETEVLNLLQTVRQQGTFSEVKRKTALWNPLVRKVGLIVMGMPLWKLQKVGGQEIAFLYSNTRTGQTIQLRPGVAYNFRRFHGLIDNIVQNAWIRHVRRIQFNQDILGQATDLQEFLFGSDRCALSVYKNLLLDFQSGCCFYCKELIRAEADVDHFIPWILYPVDLAHNFVVAHRICNGRKADHLASMVHLDRWMQRNEENKKCLAQMFDTIGVVHNIKSSLQVTQWAYGQAETNGAKVWSEGNQMCTLDSRWRGLFVGQ